MYRIKILPVTAAQIQAGHRPKYTIMVLPERGSAVPQTPELIADLNQALGKILIDTEDHKKAGLF